MLCSIKNLNKSKTKVQNVKDYSLCSQNDIMVHKICNAFIWFNEKKRTQNICKDLKELPSNLKTVAALKQTFNAMSLDEYYPLFLIENGTNAIHFKLDHFKLERFLNGCYHIQKSSLISHIKGLYVCHFDRLEILVGINIYNCRRGGYISTIHICDGIFDCPNDKSDDYCNKKMYV